MRDLLKILQSAGLWLAFALGALVPFQAHAEDARYSYPQQYSVSPKGVNLQTGRFISSKVDLSIGSMKLTRNWGDVPAMVPNLRSFGLLLSEAGATYWSHSNIGWNHNFNQGVQYWPGNASKLPRVYIVVGGKKYEFIVLSDGTLGPVGQAAQGTRLTWVSGQWGFTDREGNQFTFFAHPGIAQTAGPGNPIQVLQTAVYADGTQVDYSYNAAAQPKFVKDNRGFAIVFDYDANANVSAACGFNLAQTFADASTTCTGAALKVSYGYDATGKNLTSITDVLGRVVTITYVAGQTGLPMWLPSCISLPNVATCELQHVYGTLAGEPGYTLADQARTQTTAVGTVWSYAYIPQPDPLDVPVVLGMPRWSRATMTDATGQPYVLKYDRGHLTEQITPVGTVKYRYAYRLLTVTYGIGEATQVEYHDDMPRIVIQPEGNIEYIGHDSRQNLTQHSYWPKGAVNPLAPTDPELLKCCVSPDTPTFPAGSITYNQTFPTDQGFTTFYGNTFVLGCGSGPADAKLCSKPVTRTDALGNVTDYTYEPAHGMILTETLPAVGGVRAQTRYTYAQRYAWVKNSGGTYVQAATPVWVLTQKSICKSGAASGAGCVTPSDEVRTTYDYGPNSGPNNLLLRGMVEDATGAALRTCYGYDTRGNRISETRPRAGLASCP